MPHTEPLCPHCGGVLYACVEHRCIDTSTPTYHQPQDLARRIKALEERVAAVEAKVMPGRGHDVEKFYPEDAIDA